MGLNTLLDMNTKSDFDKLGIILGIGVLDQIKQNDLDWGIHPAGDFAMLHGACILKVHDEELGEHIAVGWSDDEPDSEDHIHLGFMFDKNLTKCIAFNLLWGEKDIQDVEVLTDILQNKIFAPFLLSREVVMELQDEKFAPFIEIPEAA